MNLLKKGRDCLNSLFIKGEVKYRNLRGEAFALQGVSYKRIALGAAAASFIPLASFAEDVEKKINTATDELIGLIQGITFGIAVLATVVALICVFFSKKGMDEAWAWIKKIWLAAGAILLISLIGNWVADTLFDGTTGDWN